MGDNESWHDNVVLQLDVLRDTAAKTEDLVHAAQELATATKSESPNDQMSRQNALNDMGAGDLFLHRLSTSKVEMVQWWMSLALTQVETMDPNPQAMCTCAGSGGCPTLYPKS